MLSGPIQDSDQHASSWDVQELVNWCSQNHLEPKPLKTIEWTFRGELLTTTPTHWTSHVDTVREKDHQRVTS